MKIQFLIQLPMKLYSAHSTVQPPVARLKLFESERKSKTFLIKIREIISSWSHYVSIINTMDTSGREKRNAQSPKDLVLCIVINNEIISLKIYACCSFSMSRIPAVGQSLQFRLAWFLPATWGDLCRYICKILNQGSLP